VSFESSRMTEGVRVRAEDARTPSTPARATPRDESASLAPPPRAAGGPGWGSDESPQTSDPTHTPQPASASSRPSSPVLTGEVSDESSSLTEGVRVRGGDERPPQTPARTAPAAEVSDESSSLTEGVRVRGGDERPPQTPARTTAPSEPSHEPVTRKVRERATSPNRKLRAQEPHARYSAPPSRPPIPLGASP
jgi:hypothetical protein